jgi:uncharacterized protein with HEPN domain
MSRRDDRTWLLHMRDHARTATEILRGKRREDLQADPLLRYALLHLVCIIGEAAARVSEDGRAKYPSIPWRSAIATRNRLIHGYEAVDLDTLWDTVEMDLPELLRELDQALSS